MKLNPGDIKCPDCKGTGFNIDFVNEIIRYNGCLKCCGTGKLDWIEAIVGKKPQIIIEKKRLRPRSLKKGWTINEIEYR